MNLDHIANEGAIIFDKSHLGQGINYSMNRMNRMMLFKVFNCSHLSEFRIFLEVIAIFSTSKRIFWREYSCIDKYRALEYFDTKLRNSAKEIQMLVSCYTAVFFH